VRCSIRITLASTLKEAKEGNSLLFLFLSGCGISFSCWLCVISFWGIGCVF
jgi:hypothetical protein